MKFIFYFLLVTSLLGCSGPDEFLHIHKNPPREALSQTHPLKELHGKNKVDIVWVIDNSGSMNDNQNQVKQNAQQFISKFSAKTGLQWKMGLISTDARNPPYIGYQQGDGLDWQTADPVGRFQQAISRLGTSGDSVERMFEPFLSSVQQYPSFLRTDAVLAIIVVSDEDEQSRMTVDNFYQQLVGLKRNADDIYTYGLFASRDDSCGTDFSYAGSKYERFMTKTSGEKYSLCDPNIGSTLAEIGDDLVKQLVKPRLFLTARPIFATIEVYYQGELLPSGPAEDGGFWLYDYGANAILFHDLQFAPGENEEVEVRYETEVR